MSSDSTVLIPLTQGQYAIVDKEDADFVNQWKWYLLKGRNTNYAHTTKRVKQPHLYMHREILAKKLGRPLTATENCDHINHNGLDNRRENLRVATHQENIRNGRLRPNNKSGRIGVHYDKRRSKWKAEITLDGKNKHLGRFDSLEDAVKARHEAEQNYFGDFSPDNSTP